MAIDASIALQGKLPQIQTPNELINNAYAMQNAQQANQLNMMKMEEYKRGVTEDSQIKNALTRLNPASPTYEQDRYNAYALKGVEGLKTLAAIKKEEAQSATANVETAGKKITNATAAQTLAKKSFEDIYARPDDNNLRALYDDAVDSKLYDENMLQGMKRRMENILSVPLGAIDPTTGRPDFSARRKAINDMQLEAKDRTPKPSNLATLQNELKDLPLNDPRRKAYEDAIRNETLNSELQTYETAVNQGFKGSIFDFKSQLAEAGRSTSTSVTKIDNFEPASVAAQKEYIKEVSNTRTQLKNVKGTLDSIDKAKALVPTAKGFMGPGGEALLKATSFLNNRIGTDINVKGITDATELRTRLFGNIMENLKKLDAQPSEAQQFIMQEALGTLGTDPNAMNKVLDAYAEVLKNKVADYNTDVTDAEARGVKFPYKPQIDLGIPTKANAPARKNPHAAKTDAQIKEELGI
jgi:hypothetical protein